MTLQELFKAYYGSNSIEQMGKSAMLYHYVRTLAEQSPGVRLIKRTLDYELGNSASVHPDTLIDLLTDMGFRGWPQLESWLQSSADLNFDIVFDMVDPPFPEIEEPEMRGRSQIANDIRYAGFPVSPFEIHIDDDLEYGLPANKDIMPILEACPSDKKSAGPNHDCDDFTNDLIGWLPRKGYGWLAIFRLTCWLIYKNGTKEKHRMACALSKERDFWIIEPQNDSLAWKWGDGIKWPNVVDLIPIRIRK